MIGSIADLVAFLKHFHRGWLDDPTLDPATIPPDLPPGLARIYRELGALAEIEKQPGPLHGQDALVPLSGLERVDGMIQFAWENQGVWSARCEPGRLDPPVYCDADHVYNGGEPAFEVVCNSLDDFLITLCLQEAAMSCRYLAYLEGVHDGPIDRLFLIALEPIWLDGVYVFPSSKYDFYRSIDGDVIVARLGSGSNIWVGSPDREPAGLITPGIDYGIIDNRH